MKLFYDFKNGVRNKRSGLIGPEFHWVRLLTFSKPFLRALVIMLTFFTELFLKSFDSFSNIFSKPCRLRVNRAHSTKCSCFQRFHIMSHGYYSKNKKSQENSGFSKNNRFLWDRFQFLVYFFDELFGGTFLTSKIQNKQ